MSFIAIVELSIGMIFAWLLLSVSAMFIQEWLVSLLNWRSTMLESTVENLVSDPVMKNQIYSHPLIKGLHSGANSEKKPSYIPSSQFSLALLDIINNSSKEAYLIQCTLYDIKTEISGKKPKNYKQIITTLNSAIGLTNQAMSADAASPLAKNILDEVKAVIRNISADYPIVKPTIEKFFREYGNRKKQLDELLSVPASTAAQNNIALNRINNGMAVLTLTNPGLKQALDALIIEMKDLGDKTENQITTAKNSIEAWFNSSMDRLSGWYKRRAQVLSFLIGLTLALSFNIDSFQLATQLWRDPSVRQIIATQATSIVEQNPDGLNQVDPNQMLSVYMQLNQLNIPVGWIGSPMQMDSQGAIFFAENFQKRCSIRPVSSVEIFGLRLGDQCYPVINTPELNDLAGWLFKVFGFLVTAAATAQGAPFWFDILKNLINIRSAGTISDAKATKTPTQ
jgi:hypothetical protein